MSNNIALITGINGMDCRCLSHLLLSKGYKVIATYRRNSWFDEQKIKDTFNNNPNFYLQVCDISCQNSVTECIKSVLKEHSRIDELYLLAANSHVGQSFNNKELSILTNGQSTYYFLEALRNLTIKTRTYFAATSELFGGTLTGSLNEHSVLHPRSPYAISKNLGYNWINFYKESYGMFCCNGILFNHSCTERSLDFFIRKVTNTAA